jgi:hypothetical protein
MLGGAGGAVSSGSLGFQTLATADTSGTIRIFTGGSTSSSVGGVYIETGAATSGAAGAVSAVVASATNTNGGPVWLSSGATTAGGTGGFIVMNSGSAATGAGGMAILAAGGTTVDSAVGGSAFLYGGISNGGAGTGKGGDVLVYSGDGSGGGTGTGGSIQINVGNADSRTVFDVADATGTSMFKMDKNTYTATFSLPVTLGLANDGGGISGAGVTLSTSGATINPTLGLLFTIPSASSDTTIGFTSPRLGLIIVIFNNKASSVTIDADAGGGSGDFSLSSQGSAMLICYDTSSTGSWARITWLADLFSWFAHLFLSLWFSWLFWVSIVACLFLFELWFPLQIFVSEASRDAFKLLSKMVLSPPLGTILTTWLLVVGVKVSAHFEYPGVGQ